MLYRCSTFPDDMSPACRPSSIFPHDHDTRLSVSARHIIDNGSVDHFATRTSIHHSPQGSEFQISRADLPQSKKNRRALDASLIASTAERKRFENHWEDARREGMLQKSMVLRHLEKDGGQMAHLNERIAKVVGFEDRGEEGVLFCMELLREELSEELSERCSKFKELLVPDPRERSCFPEMPEAGASSSSMWSWGRENVQLWERGTRGGQGEFVCLGRGVRSTLL